MDDRTAEEKEENKRNLITYMAVTGLMYGGAAVLGLAAYYGAIAVIPALIGGALCGGVGAYYQSRIAGYHPEGAVRGEPVHEKPDAVAANRQR